MSLDTKPVELGAIFDIRCRPYRLGLCTYPKWLARGPYETHTTAASLNHHHLPYLHPRRFDNPQYIISTQPPATTSLSLPKLQYYAISSIVIITFHSIDLAHAPISAELPQAPTRRAHHHLSKINNPQVQINDLRVYASSWRKGLRAIKLSAQSPYLLPSCSRQHGLYNHNLKILLPLPFIPGSNLRTRTMTLTYLLPSLIVSKLPQSRGRRVPQKILLKSLPNPE